MTKKSLWEDESARVPFAVIGIFLILISTVVSINLNRMDVEMAKTMSSNVEVTAADTALQYAKADIARAINYAGMEALKQIGETPVIKPDPINGYEYYSGTGGDSNEFNKNWAKGMINHTLNQYIEANYMYDAFVYNGFSVNVDDLDAWNKITIEPVKMKLNRTLDPPLLKPGEGKYDKGYEAYWKVSVPLKIKVRNPKTETELMSETITVETIITSRYPLLKELTYEYSDRLNGTNATMVETTAFALAYTWGRGYMQYFSALGEPENIVNNTHLALIVNGALLLDQGFVFNSADPMSIVEYVKQTASAITGLNMGDQNAYKNTSLEGGSLKIDPQKDAFNSTGNATQAEQEFNKAKQFDFNATPIADFINNITLAENSDVSQKIEEIAKSVYSGTIKTIVERSSVVTLGDHSGYPEDKGTTDWVKSSDPVMLSTIGRETNPGILYGEVWKVNWMRDHTWRKTWTEEEVKTRVIPCPTGVVGPCTETYTETVTKYEDKIVQDYQADTVTFKLYAVEYSSYYLKLNYSVASSRSTISDLNNAFIKQSVSYKSLHEDFNLEDVLDAYKSDHFSDAIKINDILTFGFTSSSVRQSTIPGKNDTWLRNETQAAVDDIRDMINAEIHLDPSINYTKYPIPSDLIENASKDLISKIEKNESRYVNKDIYITDSKYNSASAKVISLVREWYVDEVKYRLKEDLKSDPVNDKINDEFDNKTDEMGIEDVNFGDIKKANKDATKFLAQGMNLPIGLTMEAYHVEEDGKPYPVDNISAWNESITLSINQEPNYLYTTASESELITLGLRNIDIFGGIGGLKLLPPIAPWFATLDVWTIEVQGRINKFEVQDIDSEVHPDPIFGHGAQVYVREEETVYDQVSKRPIGDNQNIKFSFTTGTFIIVPPGKNIGDKTGEASSCILPSPICEESPEFNNII